MGLHDKILQKIVNTMYTNEAGNFRVTFSSYEISSYENLVLWRHISSYDVTNTILSENMKYANSKEFSIKKYFELVTPEFLGTLNFSSY